VAKASGTPNSLIVTWPAVGGRALRASRSGQQRRKCARWARERGEGSTPGSGCPDSLQSTSTRWLRRSCMHARRCVRRLQSPQSRGAGATTSGCEPQTHPAGLVGGPAMPLALLAQRTRATLADPSLIHDAQAPIAFSPPLLCKESLPSGTAQRPIRLREKVPPGEAASFPGQSLGCRSIPLGGGRGAGSLLLRGEGGWSKLGGAHSCGMKRMPEFKPQVPDPLAENLGELLAASTVRVPAVRILLLILIGKRIFKRAAMQIQPHHIGSGESAPPAGLSRRVRRRRLRG
jgi:hypothetical protein